MWILLYSTSNVRPNRLGERYSSYATRSVTIRHEIVHKYSSVHDYRPKPLSSDRYVRADTLKQYIGSQHHRTVFRSSIPYRDDPVIQSVNKKQTEKITLIWKKEID